MSSSTPTSPRGLLRLPPKNRAKGPGDGGGDRHDQGVAVAHMGQLVGQHPGHLLVAEPGKEPGGRRHRRVPGVAPGGEGVGLVALDEVDLGHGQAGVDAELMDHAHQVGGALPVDLAGAVHPQHQLVRVPIGEQVHAQRQGQGDHHPALAAQQVADGEKEPGHGGEQQRGPGVGHGLGLGLVSLAGFISWAPDRRLQAPGSGSARGCRS
jgi:hypothetical protein